MPDIEAVIAAHVRDIPDYPKPGVLFKDITPLLGDAEAFGDVVEAMAATFGPVDKVVGIEARGFILAAPVAYEIRAGFVPVRKQGKLPSATFAQKYELECEYVLKLYKQNRLPARAEIALRADRS